MSCNTFSERSEIFKNSENCFKRRSAFSREYISLDSFYIKLYLISKI